MRHYFFLMARDRGATHSRWSHCDDWRGCNQHRNTSTATRLFHRISRGYIGLVLRLCIGKILGYNRSRSFTTKKKMDKYITFSENLVHKYGNFTICISYFLPIVRHIIPYIVGINKMSFRRYALFSYSTGLIWTLIFFWSDISSVIMYKQQKNLYIVMAYRSQCFLWYWQYYFL